MKLGEEDIMVIGWVLTCDKIQATGPEDGPSAEDSGGRPLSLPWRVCVQVCQQNGVCFQRKGVTYCFIHSFLILL